MVAPLYLWRAASKPNTIIATGRMIMPPWMAARNGSKVAGEP
jgi:hypothetical protein